MLTLRVYACLGCKKGFGPTGIQMKEKFYVCKQLIDVSESWLDVTTFRSSRSQMFFKTGVLKNLAIFT